MAELKTKKTVLASAASAAAQITSIVLNIARCILAVCGIAFLIWMAVRIYDLSVIWGVVNG